MCWKAEGRLGTAGERRVHPRLREVFDSALMLVAPFFDRRKIWSDVSLEHFAQRVLREHYPELTGVEIYVFVAAARRIHAGTRSKSRRGAGS